MQKKTDKISVRNINNGKNQQLNTLNSWTMNEEK